MRTPNSKRSLPPAASRASATTATRLLLLLTLASATLIAQEAPSISSQPQGGARSLGDRITLQIATTGTPTPSIQWLRDQVPVPGATGDTLTLTQLTAEAAGSYTAVVSNSVAAVTSEPAVVEVDTRFRFLADHPVSQETEFQIASFTWADYDDDGYTDLLGSAKFRAFLYHNNRDGTFTKVTEGPMARAQHTGFNVWCPRWADLNNDGHLDLYVPTGGGGFLEKDQLFLGEGGGNFSQATALMTIDTFLNLHAALGDFDQDGRVDIFSSRLNSELGAQTQVLYWAEANGSYTRAFSSVFAKESVRRGLGTSIGDFDGDGKTDIAMAAGGNLSLVIYRNLGNRTFEALPMSPATGDTSSLTVGDFDNDGDLDIFDNNTDGVCHLLRNDGTGNFENLTDAEPVLEPGRTTGSAWGDYDNDGWLDLFVARTAQRSKDGDHQDSLFRNRGDGTFERIEAGSLTHDDLDSNGAAWADFNNDGFLDLAVGHENGPSRLYQNTGNTNHWLMLKLVGTVSNRSALGAQIRLQARIQGRILTQYREIGTTAGFGDNDPRAHFGLADATRAEDIQIRWPNGRVQTLENITAGQLLTIIEPGAPPRLRASTANTLTITGDPATTYAVESSTNLAQWTPRPDLAVTTDTTGHGSLAMPASDAGVVFLRVVVP